MRGLLLISTLAALSCTPGADQIRTIAGRELKCPAKEVRLQSHKLVVFEKVPEHKEASCKGYKIYFTKVCEGETCRWTLTGEMRRAALLNRAAYDMSCSKAALGLKKLDNRTYGVDGCNQRVTYVLSCPHDTTLWSDACTWVANTESRGPASAPPSSNAGSGSPASNSPAQEAPVAPPTNESVIQ